MKAEGKKTPSPLRYLCGILAVWTVLIGFSKFAGGRAGSGSIRIPAAALLLIVIPAAVFAISRFGTLCACMRSHSVALRRGTALLCALALSLSAFTLPAEAATDGSLSDANIGWDETAFSEGTPGRRRHRKGRKQHLGCQRYADHRNGDARGILHNQNRLLRQKHDYLLLLKRGNLYSDHYQSERGKKPFDVFLYGSICRNADHRRKGANKGLLFQQDP